MSLRKYLFSKIFITQMLIAMAIIAVLVFGFMHWLTFATNHGQIIIVPNLSKMTEEEAADKLSELNLKYELLDTVDYNAAYPKMSVVEQDPVAGIGVKEGRKVYIKLNSNGFTSVRLPNLIQQTYRQVAPTLRAMGLDEGSITYVPNIAKDMVLELKLNGKILQPGDKILKNSKIDLILGDGKIGFDEGVIDSLNVEQIPEPTDAQ